MRARKRLFARLDERRLRWLLAAFFVALAIPTAVLIAQAYRQLGWESFRGDQVLAEDLAARIDAALATTVATEEARSFADYSFLVGVGDADANFVQRSPLSTFPVANSPPGSVGYFQVDADGTLTTPLLPAPGSGIDAASYGIGTDEAQARARVLDSLRAILAENRLTQRTPPTVPAGPQVAAADEAAETALDALALAAAAAERARFASRRDDAADGDARQQAAAPPPAMVAAQDSAAPVPAPGAPARAPAASAEAPRAPAQRRAEPAQAPVSQAAFDDLRFAEGVGNAVNAGNRAAPTRVARVPEQPVRGRDAQAQSVDTQASKLEQQRVPRTEQSLIAEPEAPAEEDAVAAVVGKSVAITVGLFESELDPLALGWLDTGHFVLFRNAWRDGRRYIQGVLIEEGAFLEQTIAAAYRASSLAGTTDLVVSRRGRTIATFAGAAGAGVGSAVAGSADTDAPGSSADYPGIAAPRGLALHRARLSPPFGELELAFLVDDLVPKSGPAASLLAWTSIVLAAVLVAGFLLIYRFAASQIRLTRQQQDFVSAVSHELKTPLTAIRMYGEMLKSGWVDDAKRATYYDYIHGESERLSRLIENVLQLARLTRSTQRLERKRISVAELLDVVRSKAATQAERAGFTLEVRNDAGDAAVDVDADCFTQIAINLVDNALKFAAAAERKVVAIACRREGDGHVLFTVRDFGPGIAKGQMRKIFELFYRPSDGLTRETAGTGIGLALVQQLVAAMGGRVDVRNCEPGAEFRVSFPEHAGRGEA